MANFSHWIEGMIFIVLFAVLITGVVGNFNSLYGKSNDVGLGMNSTQNALVNMQDTGQTNINEGEASFNSLYGLNLFSSWALIKQIAGVVWSFLTGGFIENIATNMLGLPAEVGLMFRILYFISILMVILYILFKVPV